MSDSLARQVAFGREGTFRPVRGRSLHAFEFSNAGSSLLSVYLHLKDPEAARRVEIPCFVWLRALQ